MDRCIDVQMLLEGQLDIDEQRSNLQLERDFRHSSATLPKRGSTGSLAHGKVGNLCRSLKGATV